MEWIIFLLHNTNSGQLQRISYDGKAERKIYDGKPLFIINSRQYLRRTNILSNDSLEFRRDLIKYNKSFPAKETVVS